MNTQFIDLETSKRYPLSRNEKDLKKIHLGVKPMNRTILFVLFDLTNDKENKKESEKD